MAKYADACNLYGSIETVKEKLTISKEHCTSVGIDYGSILKTRFGIVAIENDREAATKKIQVSIGMPEEQINEFAISGTSEDVDNTVR